MSAAIAPESTSEPAVRIADLGMVYPGGVRALEGIDLEVGEGEFLAVLGLSGSGKSTLLRCINRLIDPTEGKVWIFGQEITALSGGELRRLRRQVAMIFQQFNLVRRHTVLANVLSGSLGRSRLLPSLMLSFPQAERDRAQQNLDRVGLGDRGGSRADALSGGQQQRVAVARALMQEPELLLADEPVANLDPNASRRILDLLLRVNQEKKITLVTVLHHLGYVKDRFERVVALKEGQIRFDGESTALTQEHLSDIYAFDEERPSELTV